MAQEQVLYREGDIYFNLDRLTTGTSATHPLKHWDTITQHIIASDIPDHEQIRATEPSTIIAEAVQDWGLLAAHDLEQQPISCSDGSPTVHSTRSQQDMPPTA